MLPAPGQRRVVGRPQVKAHQMEECGEKAFRLTKRQMEEETQRQGGFDREVRVLRWRAPRARSLRFPGCDGRPGQPDGDVAPTDQGSLVGRLVSDAVFRLVFRMDSRLHPSSLVWVPLNLTLDLCNNAAERHHGRPLGECGHRRR